MLISESENKRSLSEKHSVVVGTTYANPDEAAYALVEMNIMSPKPGAGWHRYQLIYVNRDDKLAEFRRDLGPREAFDSMQFRIPALWEHTVAELLDLATELRNAPANRFKEHVPDPMTAEEYRDKVHQEMERRAWLSRGRTIHGGTK